MRILDDDGIELDADFHVERANPVWRVVFESRGGDRNVDYNAALEQLLRRLATLDATLIECRIGTHRARVSLDLESYRLPLRLKEVENPNELRRQLNRTMAATGQAPGATGGNPTKRLLLEVQLPNWVAGIEELEAWLSGNPTDIGLPSAKPYTASAIAATEALSAIERSCEAAGVEFSRKHFHRLLSALKSRRFVILTGLAGSGKTLSARLVARWMRLVSTRRLKRFFVAGEEFKSPQTTYIVHRADEVAYEVWNSPDEDKAVKILIPRALLDEWVTYIEQNHIDESTGSIEIRDRIQDGSRWSNTMHSFHGPLKAAAFALLKKEPVLEPLAQTSDVIPVGADWTSRESFLGYPDALDATRFVAQPALLKVLDALEHPDQPFFLILDEMNLSHVERYFADFLSAMESGEPIPLYRGEPRYAGGRLVPTDLPLPDNLFVIGTVNVDETTYMFSPKVLDRAQVIEFRMAEQEMRRFLSENVKPDLDAVRGEGAGFVPEFLRLARQRDVDLPAEADEYFQNEMLAFFQALQRNGAEFGYRTAHDAKRFVAFYRILGGHEGGTDWVRSAFDAVVAQKLLPKLHGSRGRLSPVLRDLWALCRLAPDARADGDAAGRTDAGDPSRKAAADAWYSISAEKIARMWAMLHEHGFASFAEA